MKAELYMGPLSEPLSFLIVTEEELKTLTAEEVISYSNKNNCVSSPDEWEPPEPRVWFWIMIDDGKRKLMCRVESEIREMFSQNSL